MTKLRNRKATCTICKARTHSTTDHDATVARHERLAAEGRAALMAAALMSPSALAAQLAGEAPEDWQATYGEGWHDGTESWPDAHEGSWHVRYARTANSVNVAIALNLLPIKAGKAGDWDRKYAYRGCRVEGHTTFNGRTFTRRGIDVSSCDLIADPAERYGEHSYGDVAALLAGELARCLAAAQRDATAVAVPGLPFKRQPEWFTTTAEQLRAGKVVTLVPAGMGTGYTLRKGQPDRRRRFGEQRASVELERKLGVSPIAVDRFDYD